LKAILAVVVLVLALAAVPVYLMVSSTETVLKVVEQPKVIGFRTPMRLRAENQHGVRWLTVAVAQDGKSHETRVAQAKTQHMFPERGVKPVELLVSLGRELTPELHDGRAKVTVSAISNDFMGKASAVSFDVDVMTAPPQVTADGVQHYINLGGSEMATFTPSGAWTEAGVQVGDGPNARKFRSFPLPGHPGQYFSLFAYAWNLPTDTPVSVFASNPTGATARTSFWYKVFPKKFRQSTIPLESMNLERLVNQIDPEHKIQGDLVQRFVYINNEMRKQNNQRLADLRFESENKFLWSGAFLPMVDSTVESRFADDRTYTWQGKTVDRQTHLGFDLAKLAHSPIPASNDGKVVLAENLGIYGNCVVIDHGFGLMTIYGHMSEFAVKKGDLVKKAQVIGKTGFTGLAGGDHLHFSLMVDGVQVNAVEWWDPHWVKDRILSKMGADLAVEGGKEDEAKGGYPAPKKRGRKKKR
jgi:murein DD-endopeptidase MepM/ murein hydrolase activator NlpD